MKKWIIYIMLSSFILTNTDLIQVLRIPFLFSHYSEHNAEHQISFKDFLFDHYLNKNHSDYGSDSDQTLPYKSTITSVLYLYHLNTPPTLLSFEVKYFFVYSFKKAILYKAFHYTFNYLESCWNPPKNIFRIIL